MKVWERIFVGTADVRIFAVFLITTETICLK
nr:MAG TPA: hypothetical protein [Caudoviricetes sp.]